MRAAVIADRPDDIRVLAAPFEQTLDRAATAITAIPAARGAPAPLTG